MNERALAGEIQEYLRRAPRGVVYLEGKTDPAIFFALLGVAPAPNDSIHQGVLVQGLHANKGSGSSAVIQRIEFAAARPNYGAIFGLLDGDGIDADILAKRFDTPFPGPLFH